MTEKPVRYLVMNANGEIVYRLRDGVRVGRWDFTLPGPIQGGKIIDLFAERR